MNPESLKIMAKRILGGVVLIVFLAVTFWLGRTYLCDTQQVRDFFAVFPFALASSLFILAYILSSFIILDLKDILKVVAALLFGAWWSTLFIWLAELVSNVILFHMARRLGRGWIEKKFHLAGKDTGLVEKMCGIWQVFILRTIPLIPYRILDIAYGLTAIPFRRYFTVSALASPVRIFWLQFILAGVGGAVFQPEKIAAYLQTHPEAFRFGAAYLIFSFGAAYLISRKTK